MEVVESWLFFLLIFLSERGATPEDWSMTPKCCGFSFFQVLGGCLCFWVFFLWLCFGDLFLFRFLFGC